MRLLFLVLICVISCGCRDDVEPADAGTRAVSKRAPVKLQVLVIDDAGIAQGIELLAGEWSERSGGELIVAETTLSEFLAAEELTADVVVYPSRMLGEFVMRGWLRPVRQSVLADSALAWGDFFAALRDQVVRFGGEVYSLPLGEMPLVMAWQDDVPDKLPETWEQIAESGVGVQPSDTAAWPLTRAFLARAVALTTPDDRATLFFDPRTMDARLNTPQLVRALQWFVDSVNATGGPSANVTLPRANERAMLAPLPIADEIYTISLDRWERVEAGPPPVILGFAGRLVSVTSTSRNAASAFKLIPWLTSGSTGTNLSRRSDATLWCRASQVAKAAEWFRVDFDDDRTRWLTVELSRGDAYLLPRIPGIQRYLAELEKTLRAAVDGRQQAGQALALTESRWDSLTDALGRDEQRAAFNRHLGLAQ